MCEQAIDSVLKQTVQTKCYVVVDGEQYYDKSKRIVDKFADNPFLKVAYLPTNVGAKGFYGHRVYAAFTHLLDSDYVLYLDQDNFLEPNHVETCVKTIEKYNLDWSYSLRNIYDENGEFLIRDDCESLGKYQAWTNVNHIDTNCYCIKTDVAIKIAQVWHGGWGQDRVWLQALSQHFQRFECTGNYTVNYRVNGNPGSVTKEFFNHGNKIMSDKYNGNFPWNKTEL